ncbi:MAG: gas vesicle protein GvpG [Chloroherpetonaceae bacterium]|nr:gas vesicle protein GvpG [Chloroherpetonaceae bacterium]
MFIIDDILLSPIYAVVAIAETIDDQIKKERADVAKIQAKLMEIQFKFEMDELEESDFLRQEQELLRQLEEARIQSQQ